MRVYVLPSVNPSTLRDQGSIPKGLFHFFLFLFRELYSSLDENAAGLGAFLLPCAHSLLFAWSARTHGNGTR